MLMVSFYLLILSLLVLMVLLELNFIVDDVVNVVCVANVFAIVVIDDILVDGDNMYAAVVDVVDDAAAPTSGNVFLIVVAAFLLISCLLPYFKLML